VHQYALAAAKVQEASWPTKSFQPPQLNVSRALLSSQARGVSKERVVAGTILDHARLVGDARARVHETTPAASNDVEPPIVVARLRPCVERAVVDIAEQADDGLPRVGGETVESGIVRIGWRSHVALLGPQYYRVTN
jgi:hypothetical protein